MVNTFDLCLGDTHLICLYDIFTSVDQGHFHMMFFLILLVVYLIFRLLGHAFVMTGLIPFLVQCSFLNFALFPVLACSS